tara:strand:+ start:35 stop:214 length:180 start_codon:yes stop_codon:yes gene_type:complete
MKEIILEILEDHAWSQSNLSSPVAREKIADEIMKAYEPNIDLEVSAEYNTRKVNGERKR